ncbi:aromatic ring-hydroxylating oxygenase subunit alpha [Nocardia transvalensis]|uniref:aromatic ring-hydroxylating oxygenase subunit alpha n=1 Tax=Nocardia transvalensis TaxID=37333 RepID=UPI001893751E|nr:aromatic ring-hydroxylating dioxygenase subunit alpha [Nocardia transvalensis]MBF6329954.1 aromatic ring-hydroxylating dioxygenase subunit alpha [Nocardia transvalensis]
MSTAVTTDHSVDALLAELHEYLGDSPPALTLSPAAYTSAELWELERERIFARTWMLVAHTDQLAEPGDYVSVSVAGEAVVVVRADDGRLHALSPICRHRLMPLVAPGAGRTNAFTCRYHLWKYGLDGRLRGAPYMGGNKEFDPEQCRLPAFAVEEWNGLVWVNLDAEAESLSAHLDLIAPEYANYRLDQLVQVDAWRLEWRANWKLVMENGHENYHVLGLHPKTLQPYMPGGADIHIDSYSPWVSNIRIPLAFRAEPGSLELTEMQKTHGMLVMAFPCGAFIAMGDQVVWFSFIPLAIDRVEVIGGVLTTPDLAGIPEATARTQQAVTAMINEEDRSGLEDVQRGTASRFTTRGHLSPKEQPGILAFYRNLAHAMGGSSIP